MEMWLKHLLSKHKVPSSNPIPHTQKKELIKYSMGAWQPGIMENPEK
jgi:hypothetical protein